MSAWKQFLASDIIVNPFVVNKGFNFPYSQFSTGSDGQLVGIDRFLGVNLSTSSSLSTQSLYYDTLVFQTGSSTGVSGFDTYPLVQGKLLVEYSQSAQWPTSLYTLPTRIRIHNLDLNGFDVSSYVNSWTNVEFQVGQAPSGIQIRDNVILSNYSSEITGSYFDVSTLVSASDPFSVFNKLVEPTPPITITTNYNFNTFNPLTDPKTGINSSQYQRLVYNSAKQLYYSNFLSSSTGDNVAQPILFPGSNPSGDVLIGGVESPLYDNFLQSTLVPNRFFPTASSAEILVLSIPSKIYGEYIVPNSFNWYCGTPGVEGAIVDDGQGNLLSGSVYIGNIIYTHGLAILTTPEPIYGEDLSFWSQETNMTCSFSSSMTIYETQYKCTIRESEFNATLNPSAQVSGSINVVNSSSFYIPFDGTLANNVTGSYFNPYVTTVGLYDEAQNLLAIGKLSQPLPTSATTDTTILINLDR
jgi:hypothetical protein